MSEDIRPVWAEVDLGAITHNLALVRQRAGRPVRLLVPIKANAYGHGVVEVSRHLQSLGVDGLATANVDDALAARRAGVTLPILMYGSQLPGGIGELLEHGLTPTIYSGEGLEALAALARARPEPVAVHVKVDAGMGRLGVRLDEAAGFARAVLGTPNVVLEGMYTHIPFSDGDGEAWSARRLRAFTELVAAVEAEHDISIPFAQAAASSVLSQCLPDALNTLSPGHLTFGLHPMAGQRASAAGFRYALRAVRARLIHVGRRHRGDDLLGTPPGGLAEDGTAGVILFGMDNGYRRAAGGGEAVMLCAGRRCRVLAISAEYTVIDLAAVPDARVGDPVTVIGSDGDETVTVEDVADAMGAPSAAYWLLGLKSVPYRYTTR